MVVSKSFLNVVAFDGFGALITGVTDLGFSIFFAIVSNLGISNENDYKYPTFSFIRRVVIPDSHNFDYTSISNQNQNPATEAIFQGRPDSAEVKTKLFIPRNANFFCSFADLYILVVFYEERRYQAVLF
jgi:hypothetical protein